MKPTTKILLLIWAWLLWLALAPAHAFYDPAAQRWLNRDPLGETGFEILRRKNSMPAAGGPSLYAFVANSPTITYDAFGLDGSRCLPRAKEPTPPARRPRPKKVDAGPSCEAACWDGFDQDLKNNQKELAACVAAGFALCKARDASASCYGWVTVSCGLWAAGRETAAIAALFGCLDGCVPGVPVTHEQECPLCRPLPWGGNKLL